MSRPTTPRPDDSQEASEDFRRIQRVLEYLERHHLENPNLEALAAVACLSPFYFQRLFRRWAGTTPDRFARYLSMGTAKAALDRNSGTLRSALTAGLSGPGRLHDLFVTFEAMTPGEYKSRGQGLLVRWGVHPTPFGETLVGLTDRGLWELSFWAQGEAARALEELRALWPRARFEQDVSNQTASVLARLFGGASGPRGRFHLLLRGTNFQIKVWQALLALPSGALASYGELAASIGRPEAARAVGRAVGANHLAYLIPCHRVIRGLGALGGYRWGLFRKRALIAWERGRLEAGASFTSGESREPL